MSDVVDQFYARTDGRRISSCGGIPGECVSASQNYTNNELQFGGCPAFPVAYAYQMMGTRQDVFLSVYNTPTGVPPRGAIVVFNQNMGGGAGHTGVVVNANQNTLDVYQQNDPYGSGMHVKVYNYNNVSGWLIPKNWINQQPEIPKPQQGDKPMTPEEHKQAYQVVLGRDPEPGAATGGITGIQFIQAAIPELTAQRQANSQHITDLQKQVDNLSKLVADSQKIVGQLQDQLKIAGADKDSLNKKIEELNQKINDTTTNQVSLDNYSLGELLAAAFRKTFKIK